MAITAAMVKELRDATGAGMMDAKKALTETGGNMDEAPVEEALVADDAAAEAPAADEAAAPAEG